MRCTRTRDAVPPPPLSQRPTRMPIRLHESCCPAPSLSPPSALNVFFLGGRARAIISGTPAGTGGEPSCVVRATEMTPHALRRVPNHRDTFGACACGAVDVFTVARKVGAAGGGQPVTADDGQFGAIPARRPLLIHRGLPGAK